MRFGLIFIAIASGLVALAASYGGAAWLLLWPAITFAVVGAGYLGLGAGPLAKRADGTRPLWALVVWFPYLATMRTGWQLLRWLTPEDQYNEVAPGLFVGRRCLADELPEGTRLVVDMTAELTVPVGVRERARYLCVPTLDGHVPSRDALRRLVDEMVDAEPPVYVHCAAGHGRSATVAAAVLLARGQARDVEEAIAIMRRSRPGVRLMARQRRMAALFAQA